MCRAFAPVRAAHGGGAMLNVLSVASRVNSPRLRPHGLSKSAAWALTNGLRTGLRGQGTLVSALHMGFVVTELVRGFDFPQMTPEDVATQALAGVAAGSEEILAAAKAHGFKRGLTVEPPVYLNLQDCSCRQLAFGGSPVAKSVRRWLVRPRPRRRRRCERSANAPTRYRAEIGFAMLFERQLRKSVSTHHALAPQRLRKSRFTPESCLESSLFPWPPPG